MLQELLIFHINATYLANLILLVYQASCNSSLYDIQSPITFSPLRPDILLSIVVSNASSL
jgi:hypothetical protein